MMPEETLHRLRERLRDRVSTPGHAGFAGPGSSLRRSAQTVEYHPCQAKLSARAR